MREAARDGERPVASATTTLTIGTIVATTMTSPTMTERLAR